MKTKRIWSFFLTVALLLSFFPGIAVPADAADNYNQLINGNFDQGETGWSKNQHFTAGSVTDGVLVVSTAKTSSGDAIFYQGMNLVPGTYVLTFDGKGTANQYRPILYIGINQWSNAYGKHFLKDFGFNQEWKTATVSFTIPESAAGANGLAPVYVALWTSNGSYAPEAEMQLDNFAVRKLLQVTTGLSNVTLDSEITEIAQGLPYENTVTANTGYNVAEVTVTMGGVELPNAYDPQTGKISVAAVTGDLHIQVQAAQTDPGNQLVNGNFDQGAAGWANNGIAPSATVTDGVLTVSTEKTASGDARTYTKLQLEKGTYQLSFQVKGKPNQYRPIVGVSKNYWTYSYGQYMLSAYELSETQWTTVTETFSVDSDGEVYVTIWGSNQLYAPETPMQFDNFAVRKLLQVTTGLSNVTLDSEITEIAQGLSYENTVIPNDGYAVSKVTVTMGGEKVTDSYDPQTGKLHIAAVTGALHIQIEAAQTDPDNLLVNGNFDQGETGWINNGTSPAATVTDGVLTVSTEKTASGDARTYTKLQLEKGTYQLSFQVKGKPNQYRPIVGVSKNYWTYSYGQYMLSAYALSETQWTTVTETFSVDSDGEVYVTIWGSNQLYAPETPMQFDNFAVRKLLQVTTELSNAALSAQVTALAPGEGYESTVTAGDGFRVTKVTVTMGGLELPNAYDPQTGRISIAAVTGDLHIQVETAAVVGYNLLPNGDFEQGNTGWANNGVAPSATVADGVLTLPAEKTAEGDARTYAALQLAPGAYQLRFRAKGTPEQYRPYVSVSKNYWTNDYGQYFMYDYSLNDTDWTTVTEFFVVPESAAGADGLAPVYVTIWNSNQSYGPVTPMQFDDFQVYKCLDVILQNPGGADATGLADYTPPYAVDGQSFIWTLTPESDAHQMTVSCTMGGVSIPVTANADGTSTVQIETVTDTIVITVDSRKSSYAITSSEGIHSDNPAAAIAHGIAYSANITSNHPNKLLQSLTYTMGSKTVKILAVDGVAALHIPVVTGDITITAELVDKNTVMTWSFDVSGKITGFGGWGDAAESVAIAHNGYYDGKNSQNGRPIYTAEVAPDLLSITTNLPAGASSWANASTVIGYKLPADLELGATYIMNLPIYAGNDNTSLVSSRKNHLRSGVELVFTTLKPENMWNAGDKTVTRLYADGTGVLAASAPCRGGLTTDDQNVLRISFKVTEKIKEYAAAGNYLTLIVNHQHSNGSYQLGNAFLSKVTDPVTVKFNIGNSDCSGPRIVQRGDTYIAQLAAKPGYSLGAVSYTMGGKTVKVPVKNGVAKLRIEAVTGNLTISATTWSNTPPVKPAPKPAILGVRPSPSPYNDYPYICDEEFNLMPNFGFEEETNYLENSYSQIVEDANAWDGSHSLHYAPVMAEDQENLLKNGDFAQWDPAKKTITDWQFNNQRKLNKLELVELDGRHAVKLLPCSESDNFNMELTQRVYLEADFTYTFSFDFYGVAHWGPNLVIYDGDMKNITTMNAKTTGTEGEWTTLSTTYRPTKSGYYVFAVRIHNAAYPQKEQYVSNCAVTLKSTRVEYALEKLKPNTDYWLTMFVKAAPVADLDSSFITFGITVPSTGNFILTADPSSEGGRPYKAGQQLVPMAYDGQWHVLTVPFNTKEMTELNFTIDGLNCEVWFDNIYIFEEANAKTFVAPVTDKGDAVVTDSNPSLLGCEDDKNLFENHDLQNGNAFWGDDTQRFGLFGNVLSVADSGSQAYGNALHYASDRPNSTYYIKWVDVEPNTEYTFFARFAIAQPGKAFMGLVNGYRLESDVTENRLFPTLIQRFDFSEEHYLESLAWQSAAVTFHSGERNRIGFIIYDGGGEAYIDELRLFRSSDGIALEVAEDTLSSGPEPETEEAAPTVQQPNDADIPAVVLWSLIGVLLTAAAVSLMIILKKRKNKQ